MCEQAINSIDKKAFAELKGLSTPPIAVKMIADMITLMFGLKPLMTFNPATNKKEPDSWPAFKKFIADPYVMN